MHMKQDVEDKLNLANRRYDAMPPEARNDAKRAELAALENAPSGLGVGDALNFALGAGGMGWIAHEVGKRLPKNIVTAAELQEKVVTLLGHATAAVTAGTPQAIAQEGLQALKSHGINPDAKPIKALATLTADFNAANAGKIGEAKTYITKTLHENAPYAREYLNSIQEKFPGGMKGLAVSASVLTGLVVMANGIDLSNRYKDARISSLKQDVTHADMVEMRRAMEQMVADKQR
jgi:hypothetical protein